MLLVVAKEAPAMAYPYRIHVSEEERADLRDLVGSGIAPARTLTRARILLTANHGEGGRAGPGTLLDPVAGLGATAPSPTASRTRSSPHRRLWAGPAGMLAYDGCGASPLGTIHHAFLTLGWAPRRTQQLPTQEGWEGLERHSTTIVYIAGSANRAR